MWASDTIACRRQESPSSDCVHPRCGTWPPSRDCTVMSLARVRRCTESRCVNKQTYNRVCWVSSREQRHRDVISVVPVSHVAIASCSREQYYCCQHQHRAVPGSGICAVLLIKCSLVRLVLQDYGRWVGAVLWMINHVSVSHAIQSSFLCFLLEYIMFNRVLMQAFSLQDISEISFCFLFAFLKRYCWL